MSTSSNSQMHNDIMAAGSKERPLMLSLGPHIMTEITHSETPKDGDRARVPGYTEKGIYSNTDPENMKLIDAEVESRLNGQDIDEEAYEQELETNYMYIEKIQEVLHAIDNNSGPTYDTEPLEKVYTDDDYNLFATERQHSMQPESINDTYVVETVDSNVNPDLTNMCNNEGKDDQNAKEPENERLSGRRRLKSFYVTPSHTKKVFANMKRSGKGFSGRFTPLFPTMMIQASEDMGEDLAAPFDSHSTPIISQPSSSQPQKKKTMRKQRKDSGSQQSLITKEAHVSTALL
ncbi:hypothetical protein Tco_0298417 [Tanacetum coccineum]